MRVIKEKNLTIISQKMDSNCEIEIATRKSNEKTVYGSFQNLFEVEVKIIE
jgi:hypothetical protein